MDMTGERRIAAPRQTVWDALNDPADPAGQHPRLRKPGKAVRHGDAGNRGRKGWADVGSVQRQGPPRRPGSAERLHHQRRGPGRRAGFAKGGAKVHLTDDGSDTLLQYEVNAQVGGKLAQLGARLIDATAKQMADAFFDRFSAQVAAPPPIAAAAVTEWRSPRRPLPNPPSAIGVSALVPREPFGLPMAFWVGGLVYLFMLILIIGSLL